MTERTPWDDDETPAPAPAPRVNGHAHARAPAGISLDDFRAYMPMHSYIYIPTRALWPAASVNSRLPKIGTLSAAAWLDRYQPVEQMTWAPGLPEIIEDRLLFEGGWVAKAGARAFNQYMPAIHLPGNAADAARWVEHLMYVYPIEAEHIMNWLAHRVQRPWEKCNHALVLGGGMGIGKDTILEPVKAAVGPWNFTEASPTQICGPYNAYAKSVILRISEARDLGEVDRYSFYDHTKTLTAAPPDVLTVNEKHIRQYPILNVCGVVITTNYKTDGIYLPADDRRNFCAWSDRTKEDARFAGDYWTDLYRWYHEGGNAAVAAFLRARDISKFDAKAPPPKTPAFWAIVDANRPAEEGELADLLDGMSRPGAFTLRGLQREADRVDSPLHEWLLDRKSRRALPHRLEKCGYVPVRNPDASDGLWRSAGSRQVIYAKVGLTLPEMLADARGMVERSGG